MSSLLWSGHIYFAFTGVRHSTLLPLILRKTILAVFTKFDMQYHAVSNLLGIAFGYYNYKAK